jgi:purine catabolism regulator
VTTLAELRAELLPAARVVWPESARRGRRPVADRPVDVVEEASAVAAATISWVRVMRARVPAFDALEPGDLAIVPAPALAVLAQGPDAVPALAGAVAGAPVSGVVLVEGEAVVATPGPDPLDELAGSLRRARIPTIRLARTDVAALERSVIGFIVARGAELERQAALLERQLERLAIEGGGAAALVTAIAEHLGRAVALESPRGQALAVHAPTTAQDAGAAVAAYHARPASAAALRVTLPGGPSPVGRLVLLGERPVTDLERVAMGRVVGVVALELARDEAVRRAGDSRRGDAPPPAGPPWVVLLARQRGADDDDSPASREGREAARREVRLLAPARRMSLRGDADSLEVRAVIAVDDAATPDLELPRRIGALLGRTVAISRPFTVPGDRPTAEAEARATLEAAVALGDPPPIARAERLPIYRMLGALHNLAEGERLARAILEPLLRGRPDVRRERLATLRALLDHGGVNEAAHALGVHRNTVAYRVRRIEAATGWRLSDPELRLPLALALRLVQEEQV